MLQSDYVLKPVLSCVLSWCCLFPCVCLLCCRLMQLITPGSRQSTWICGWFSAGPEPPCFPPHRPFNYAIDLLLSTSPPRGHLFSLSGPEREAMDEYIQESITAGLIHNSSSPAGTGFFFVKRKDGSLRPCIDYRGLNDITVKIRHPLPLISSAFELLQGAKVFTKLDLHNTYHLVRIREGDEWKTAFNTPTGHYEYLVLPFGLTNSPAVFQDMVNSVLGDMINQFVSLSLCTSMIFSSFLLPFRYTLSTCANSSNGCWRTSFMSRWRMRVSCQVSFISGLYCFSWGD